MPKSNGRQLKRECNEEFIFKGSNAHIGLLRGSDDYILLLQKRRISSGQCGLPRRFPTAMVLGYYMDY